MSISPLRIALVAGGAALLAAWLVAATGAPGESGAESAATPTVALSDRLEGPAPAGSAAADLGADLERLRLRATEGPALQVGVRNPFSLAPLPPAVRAIASDPAREQPGRRAVSRPPRRVGPAHKLIGVASDQTEEGPRRIGILSAPNGDVLLVGAGDRVPGGYRVGAVEPSSVTLVDDSGTRHRLDLPRESAP